MQKENKDSLGSNDLLRIIEAMKRLKKRTELIEDKLFDLNERVKTLEGQ